MGLFDRIQSRDSNPSVAKKNNVSEKVSETPSILDNSEKVKKPEIKVGFSVNERAKQPVEEFERDSTSSILDKYFVKVDDIDFDVIIEKENGVTLYKIPEITLMNTALAKFSDMDIKTIKAELSESTLQKLGQIQGYLKNYSEKNNLHLRDIEILHLSHYFYLIIGKLGLLEIPLNDSKLEEVMVNGVESPSFVFHRKYQMCETNIRLDRHEATRVVESIAYLAGRTIDSRTPMLDAFLPDGSRVNATMSDVTLGGNTITIRKFSEDPLTIVDLINFGTFDLELAAFLWQAVEGYFGAKPANTLIVGGTGSGKTTTLNVVSMFSMYTDRLVTIEDTPELQVPLTHLIKMITRPGRPGIQGYEITMDDLIKNSLRMRPDRIFVGEVRGSEAHSLLVAMNTGHDGCSGTLHANSADEALIRLINPPMNVPKVMMSSVDFIINQQRIKRNKKTVRRILGVVEIGGSGENITKTELFKYDGISDSVVKTGICMWEEDVCQIAGITRDELMDDRINRKKVLKYMVNNNINDIRKVGDVLKQYQENPENVLKNILE
ncbi:type II/IV secretion system ATPase subunit [Methanococcus maripaludis]|uniref:Conjugal transfer protein n=2 Tax=Methanococcus maripaludis TaxID=39152 RepID=A0A2L1CAT1_METMI|nr:ATPase, T2SS/T4P/T4SS family [Methanococcus maripaludis]AVB76454.1 Putative conjugal transfer protein [Methanococcus maripaludis]MBA2845830.1 flagellar protein FlaI [Methanococcus maripaludis]MBA2851886.1 flagellar protein FlaI [Methanococcus maripaludis]MBB6068348.1 flagellar protein FlaI [Methanococcus maripaludis]MBB6497725.1 flagellar protein FlaI [Methanococcus maripaludis]